MVFKLGTLNELVELVARIPRVQDLLGLVLDRTMQTVRATIGSIMLVDRERQTLRIAAARGLSDEVIANVEVGLGEGIAGRVAQLREPVLVEDVETDPRFAKANDPKYGGGSFICMPVRVGDRVIGVINLAKKEYGAARSPSAPPFTLTDLQFLNTLMTHIAYALDNRLLEEARESAKRLQEVVADQQVRLTRAQQQKLQAEKVSALGQLLAGVAHELNNPLSVIVGQAAFLRRDAGGEPVATRAEKIASAADRCARIVRNFLSLARQQAPERRKVMLNDVVREAAELFAYQFRVDNVEVSFDLADDLPLLWADPHQLHQVVVNLLSNAHQAMRETLKPRRMTLATRHDPRRARAFLEVTDTGPGISPEIQAQIFEPFFTTKPLGQGTGLGLSLCRGIVEAHGGVIRVESKPGQRTIFVVELPVPGLPGVEPPAETPELGPPSCGKRILVVDDEPEVAEVLAELLAADDHRVDTAQNGMVALGKLQERAYDLVLSDIRMPELDGPGLYREIERRYPRLARRVVFLTGDTLSANIREYLEKIGRPSLSKPFAVEEVRRAVQSALERT
jgi:signal transduction histidine kinase